MQIFFIFTLLNTVSR